MDFVALALVLWFMTACVCFYTLANHFLNNDPFSIPVWEDIYSTTWLIVNFCALLGWGIAG